MGSRTVENYFALRDSLEKELAEIGRKFFDVTLVAVTKNATVEQIGDLYEVGHRDFGENYVQQALPKIEVLPKDIKWHFIGSVQKNKINKILGRFELVHSVNSQEIADALDVRARRENIVQDVLVEVNASGEKQKHGVRGEEAQALCFHIYENCENLRLLGLMTMAPYTNDAGIIEHCFRSVAVLRESLQRNGLSLHHLSMGMTNDWKIALRYGATILRIGTAIFGERKNL